MNDSNLRVPTSAEARDIGRKGGIASGKARLRKKHGRELVRAMLEMKATDADIIERLQALGITAEEATNEVALHARQMEKAQRKGDTQAYTALMKAAGYDVLNVHTEGGVNISVGSQEVAQALGDVLKRGAQPRKPDND